MLSIVVFLLYGCADPFSDQKLTELQNRVEDLSSLEGRVEALEKKCNEINANLNALKTVVDALETKVSINKVDPVMKDG